MFSALKYHAVDYLYEKMSRQRFSFEWLSVHIPSCLYQDKNYYHEGGFADDKYRRPWKRVSVDSTLIMINVSVLDHWKANLHIEDFLEKKPISSTFVHIDNEDIDVVPSSNGSSQFSIEEVYLLTKNNKEECTHANHLQFTYVPIILKEQEEDLHIEEELIFTENLTQYSKWIPNLRTLLSRLSLFQVQDPFLNSKGDSIREEDIFRECFTFQRSMTSQEKGRELLEDFCKMTLSNEETLVLPLKLQSNKTTDLLLKPEIPTCSALKLLLQVTPEAMPNESEDYEITSKDIKTNITSDIEISQYCPTHEVSTRQSSSAVEFRKPANYTLLHAGELEEPLTPVCRSENVHVNSLYAELQLEPISPFTKSVLITETTKGYTEALVWHSEKYQHPMNSLLLAEHQTSIPTCQQLPVTDLKKLLSVHEDTSVLSPQEDIWINLRKNLASPCVLETLSPAGLDGEKSLVGANVEEFSKIANFLLQECLDENSVTKNKVEYISDVVYGDTEDSRWSLQQNKTFPQQSLGTPSGVLLHSANTSSEKCAKKDKLQSETETLLLYKNQEEEKNDRLQPTDCKKVSVEANRTSGKKKTSTLQLPRTRRDDFDLLSNFIRLRSKHMINQMEETRIVDIQEAGNTKKESAVFENLNSSVATVVTENQAKEDEDIVTIQIKASESQFQAYHILEATVAPVLKELGMHNWRFATLSFDDTRFFLKQQEKMLSDTFKQGVTNIKDAKDIAIFKHAAVLHLLVTVRDILLTCSLNAALGYLSKAKDRYKDFLGSSMDNIWRQLNIVQFARQREHEASPKIAELHHQVLKRMPKNTNEQQKVVIVTGMDFDDETAALIKTIGTVQGLKAVHLNSEKRGALLESTNVVNSLKRCSCVIVHNQHIGPDFPWTHFSLVVDYNCSGNSFWTDVCRKLNVSYITFVTAIPETLGTENIYPDNFERTLLQVQIPYVFLTSEGLLSTPEILQLLESKYNITFIERSCCEALWFFGSTDRYVVMTLDECTAVMMQNIEELSYEKSSDFLVLKLMVLSLQYSCCWIILYSREKLNSEYSFAGKVLHQLALVYAALVAFAQKSEDFEVKVALTPGVEETALLIRQIADYILMTSKRHPQEWLDKSWLSVLPSEAEKCLLTFPCMNPLVAQVMLKKSPSLEWLLTATLDQLQKLLPEVPEKVLKHFSEITTLYTLNSPTESKSLGEVVPLQDNVNSTISSCPQVSFPEDLLSSSQGHSQFNEYTRCFNKAQNSKNCSPVYYQNESCAPLQTNARQNFMASSFSYQDVYAFQERNQNIGSSAIPEEGKQYLQYLKSLETERRVNSPLQTQNNFWGPTHINFETKIPSFRYSQGDSTAYLENSLQKGICLPKVTEDQKLHVPVSVKNPIHQDSQNLLEVPKQPLMKQHNSNQDSKHSWYLVSNRENFSFQQSSCSFLGEFGRATYSSPEYQFEESYPSIQKIDFSPHDPRFCKGESCPDRFLQINEEHLGKKRPNLLSSNQREQDTSADLEFTQILNLKKRRLTFEKDPGRTDGQTRLKFF
ncbi:protein shortage in chiasmata 1 ortholog [Tiliqua scincoides]|uniref:protein shortage in chiasmata 1 ortholog n=1 Tax=Tiliqua scincoides TaxID=71010 RepID=UPI0034635166